MEAVNSSFIVKLDVGPVEKALSETLLSHKQIMRKVLTTIGNKQVKIFNSAIASATTSRSGELKKTYTKTVKVTDTVEKVTFYAKDKTRTKTIYPKLMALNYGATIRPLKKKVLHFKVGGWYSANEVQITPRHFLEPAWQSYIGSGMYEKDVQDMIEKELSKFWG